MPTPDAILAGAVAIANDWRWLAIAWHAVFIGAVIGAIDLILQLTLVQGIPSLFSRR